MVGLREYPHVITKLKQLWGNYEAISEYISGISISDRNSREGFSLQAWLDLQFIERIHKELFSE